ncbi:MAG: repair protein SbcC/Rad50, partial [Microbacteriaceae bacterium]|nr:repair protein SbcC/Rad50 [Microbacteriaceae bacterium]
MRITRLRLAGFGPYRGEQQVDFTHFDADGIFLITGRTGAGKSSILDAVCFALYGDVPRYDGRERQVRSQHCGPGDPSEVELDLLIGDAEYRIRRTPKYERAKRTGTGTTTAEPEALLSVREADGWRPVATKPKEVAAALGEVLPIRRDQFLQVILLAQNRFQEFLLAPTEDRRSLLRTLFGTSRFERLELDLLERRKELGQQVADADREIRLRAATVADLTEREPADEPGPEWFDAAVAAAQAAVRVAEERLERARRTFADADALFHEAQSLRQRQARRDDARTRLAALADAEPRIATARSVLQEARRAEAARPQIEAAERAAADVQEARAEQRAAGAQVDLPAGAEPAAVADGLLTVLGGLERAAQIEQRQPEFDAATRSLAEPAQQADDALGAAEQELAALPAKAAAVGDALAAAAAAAGSLEGRVTAETEAEAAQ